MKKHMFVLLFLVAAATMFAVPRNLVVVEIGTGTWCQYCPGAAMGADDLTENNQPVAIIENHNGDNYANTYSNARNSYYAITGYPTALFDGLNPSVGGSNTQSLYSTYLPKVNSRINVASHYTISAVGTLTGNNFSITVTVAKPEDDANTNVVLHSAITESNIQQSWQGQTHLNFVNRLMLPNQNGTPVNLTTGGQQTITLSGTFSDTWNMNTCQLVLFLQNPGTKEILQGIKYTLPGILGVNPVSAANLSFPDTYVSGSSSTSFTINNFFGTAVTGTMATSNPAFTLPQSTFSIAPYQSVTLQVGFSPTAAQNYTGNLTINSNLNGFNNVVIPLTGTGFNNAPPSVSEAHIVGPPVIFQDLTAVYMFSDPDGNTEGSSDFQWMRIVNNIPEVIAGATSSVYNVAIEDLGWRLAYQVTPRDQFGMPGTPVLSAYTLPIEDLQSPQNLTGQLTPPNTVTLNWQKPMYFDTRGFIGYRLYRNGSTLTNIMDVNILTYVDANVPDGTLEYWISAIYSNPLNFSYPSNTVTIVVNVPNSDELAPMVNQVNVYPNPFSATTTFDVVGKANSPVKVEIYNLKGQWVNTLLGRTDSNGTSGLIWNGIDKAGMQVNNGVYLYKADVDGTRRTGKIIVNK